VESERLTAARYLSSDEVKGGIKLWISGAFGDGDWCGDWRGV